MAHMDTFMSYDPWTNVTSRNGIPGDELISMLQKSIRRGIEQDAMKAAYEMHVTSPQFHDKMWRRLLSISVEDIGFGDPHAPELVYTLYKMSREFPYNDGDQPGYFMQAICYLCRCKKERSVGQRTSMILKQWEHNPRIDVPDYACDLHTKRGRAMGRDELHFLNVASRVDPQLEGEEIQKIHNDYVEFVKHEKELTDTPDVRPFDYNCWQY